MDNTGKQVSRRSYKNTGETVPVLGFGLMRLPQKDGKIDYPAAESMVDLAMKSGCNYFDTAYIYHGGESEKFAGNILSRYPRESFYLASKMTVWIADSPSDIERIFQEQLERCHTDYFDYYLLHSVNESVWQKSLDFKVLDFLKQKKAAGRIRKLGFSFHDTPEFLRKVVAAYPWDFAQIQLNYLDWELSRAGEQYEILTQAGVPVIIMEPVRGGALASLCPEANALLKGAAPDLGIASWALRYAASLPNVLCVLSGMSDETQLLDNIGTFSPLNCLTESEQNILSQAIEVHKKYLAVPCTGCRYCMPCPSGVAIPENFSLYNHYKVYGGKWQFQSRYKEFEDSARASACVSCGKCALHCPQKIDIPKMLKQVDAEVR